MAAYAAFHWCHGWATNGAEGIPKEEPRVEAPAVLPHVLARIFKPYRHELNWKLFVQSSILGPGFVAFVGMGLWGIYRAFDTSSFWPIATWWPAAGIVAALAICVADKVKTDLQRQKIQRLILELHSAALNEPQRERLLEWIESTEDKATFAQLSELQEDLAVIAREQEGELAKVERIESRRALLRIPAIADPVV